MGVCRVLLAEVNANFRECSRSSTAFAGAWYSTNVYAKGWVDKDPIEHMKSYTLINKRLLVVETMFNS